MQDFRRLNIWQKSHTLTLAVYEATRTFPKDEVYGLTSQVRRACSSIPANIAEGCGREGGGEFGRFLQIAMGSVYELEYHLLLAHDLKLLNDKDYDSLNVQLGETRKMIRSLAQKVKEGQKKNQ